MQPRRVGLVGAWDSKRRFVYLFVPRDNDSLEIVELEDPYFFEEHLPCNRELHECPPEVVAEINMSLGHAGWRRTRWEKFQDRLWQIRTAPRRLWSKWRHGE